MKLGYILFCCALVLLVHSSASAQGQSSPPRANYQMHSWKDSNGAWNFCIMPRNSIDECVSKGLAELKKRISGLPAGSVIYWVDQTPGSGAKLGVYPPPKVIRDIKSYAERHHVKVEILSSNPLGPG